MAGSNQLRIRFTADSFAFYRETMTGEIWMEFDAEPFPERRWNDFPVRIVSWWCTALSDFLGERQLDTELMFMDGPYSVHLTSSGDDWDQVTARSEDSEFSCVCDPWELGWDVWRAAHQILDFWRRCGIATRDDAELLAARDRLTTTLSERPDRFRRN